ncbi:hypothetical protein DFH94DRAFT_244294 [Russula ochroleuca]|jgi:hypothetical protein|uniref:Uncharacterized protein n=1 Tax=Russula ochroleuca TaxID=152965 RepID=A0A9P5N2G1_9AGAM|nr:hypothetical protein DFH94DRAFT_244294 [Russula ochroleuca]
MMMFSKLPAFFGIVGTVTLAIATLALQVHAHPVWHDFDSRNSLDSFITGSSYLLAGGVKFGVPYYLTTPSPTGSTGNLTVSFLSSPDGAPLFSVHNGQLYHHANESHFLYVNALNATQDMHGSLLFRLTLADQRDGLLDAVWRWRGAFLYLDHGGRSNHGLYYKCASGDGEGVYTSFDFISTPEGCGVVTLHSSNVDAKQPGQRPLSA